MARIQVKVVPGASRDRVAGRYGDGIRIQVSAAPEKGKANDAVIRVLAEALGIKENQISLIQGHSQPRKKFEIAGLTDTELAERLCAACGE